MKVSTRVEYGMLALTDIALYSDHGSSVSAPEIAERQNISQKYLEGLRGGYALTRTADKISIAEVLNALDSDILDDMNHTGNETERNLRKAVNACLWEKMNRLLTEFAEHKTLSDFIQECRDQMSGEWDLYII